MTIEKLISVCSMFDVLKEQHPELYAKIFGDCLPKTLDIYVSKTYGKRCVNLALSEMNSDGIKQYLQAVFFLGAANWDKMFDVLNSSFSTVTDHTENETSTGQVNRETLDAEKNFNDVTFDDNNRSTTNDTSNTDKTRTYKTTVTDGTADSISKKYNISLLNIRKMIIFDVVNEIAVDVYR